MGKLAKIWTSISYENAALKIVEGLPLSQKARQQVKSNSEVKKTLANLSA